MPEKMTTPAAGYREGTLRPRGGLASRYGGGSRTGARRHERQERVQRGGELVDRAGQLADSARRVEQVRHGAEQVAEQVARAWHGVDAHLDLVRPHDEAEQVQVDGTEREVEDLTGGRDVRQRLLGGLRERRGAGAGRGGGHDDAVLGDALGLALLAQRAAHLADGDEVAVAGGEA